MHIPDGFLTANICAAAWGISLGGLWYCLKKTALVLKEKMIPLMGVMSAFIFAAQMLKFPVFAGTSSHLLGAVMAAILLGPYLAAIVLTSVLVIQCIIFQDGGLTTLGANILNMSFIGAIGGYFVYSIIRKILFGKNGIIIATAISAWLSVVMASIACAIELALSSSSPLRLAIAAMAGVHVLSGIGEAIITCLVISFILKVRPDLIYRP